jgi:glycosyltransferase involved in cell wall biosynthesis
VTVRVLMLGWEFPPHISGGLGTACEGLSQALARAGAQVMFVVPRLLGGERSDAVTVVDADGNDASRVDGEFFAAFGVGGWTIADGSSAGGLTPRVPPGYRQVFTVPAALKPYLSPDSFLAQLQQRKELGGKLGHSVSLEKIPFADDAAPNHYGSDLFGEVQRYAFKISELFKDQRFDLIHCHDWMTFPAAAALSRATGRPWVAHIHSLERDRSGIGANQEIQRIEGWGINAADAVVAVSHYTADQIHAEYGVARDRIAVVHNGVYLSQKSARLEAQKTARRRMILFLGRVTFQKGPDYFVEAAAKVAALLPDVIFVMAGAGDMLERCRSRVAELKLTERFSFPGFLRGQEVEEVFSSADLYVMPSVSEPFGISALEAISHEIPVLISKQSGVSEVLRHALKVDFWDVERMADLMMNALEFPELRADMVRMAQAEVKRLRWDASAERCLDLYRFLV